MSPIKLRIYVNRVTYGMVELNYNEHYENESSNMETKVKCEWKVACGGTYVYQE